MTDLSSFPRKAWMSALAKADPARLAALMPDLAPHEVLRRPEIGAVMVQGRAGATGARFNLGEMTVTRASVRLASGEVGHAWVQGRDKDHALRAAVLDAAMQGPDAPTAREIIATLLAEAASARQSRAEKAAATKVAFFTMVRGEDK